MYYLIDHFFSCPTERLMLSVLRSIPPLVGAHTTKTQSFTALFSGSYSAVATIWPNPKVLKHN